MKYLREKITTQSQFLWYDKDIIYRIPTDEVKIFLADLPETSALFVINSNDPKFGKIKIFPRFLANLEEFLLTDNDLKVLYYLTAYDYENVKNEVIELIRSSKFLTIENVLKIQPPPFDQDNKISLSFETAYKHNYFYEPNIDDFLKKQFKEIREMMKIPGYDDIADLMGESIVRKDDTAFNKEAAGADEIISDDSSEDHFLRIMGGALIKTIAGPIMRAIVPPLMTKIIDDSSLRREEKEAITNGITNYIGKQQYSVEEKRIILQKIDERMVIFD
jgi:hypothetical protein